MPVSGGGVAELVVVGGKRVTNALQMTGATQQVSVEWIAALCRLISQLTITVLYHKQVHLLAWVIGLASSLQYLCTGPFQISIFWYWSQKSEVHLLD